jgi:Pyridoxamine 5'-phosphate oxidase
MEVSKGAGALSDELRAFLDREPVGVLATITADGKPRQSLVYFVRDGERLLISTLMDRQKSRDVRRTGWASLSVMGHEPPIRRRRSRGRPRSSQKASPCRPPGSRSASAVPPSRRSR